MSGLSSRAFYQLLLILVSALLLPASVMAEEAAQVQPAVDNSRFQFAGQINSAGVSVRSGPGEAYYATQKLDAGAKVTVVGIKFDWLKIIPPDGSFCYVSKLYVERRGDGTVGRVTKPDIRVRAGSELSPMKTTVLTTLNVGDDVNIIGEQDEYYKIAPPQTAYLYVNKQFVDPVKALAINAASTPAGDASQTGGTAPIDTTTPPTTQPQIADAGVTNPPVSPTTLPSLASGAATTQPSEEAVAALQGKFDAIETDFNAAAGLPLDKQPANDLKTRYEAILNSPGLPDTIKRTVDFRLAVLNVRIEAQRRLAAVRQVEQETANKTMILAVEKQELTDRLNGEKVDTYAAVGQLQTSSLQVGAGTLFRLIDPANGRTVIYLRSTDAKTMDMIGQFVGVRGETTTDDRLNLKVIAFTDIAVVNPSDVNTKVEAEFIPPSLVAHSVQASTGN